MADSIIQVQKTSEKLEEADRQSLLRVISPWSSGALPSSGWSVGRIKTALSQHIQGSFNLSTKLMDIIGEDSEIPSSLEKRINATLKSKFEIEHELESLEKELGIYFYEMAPYGELYGFLKSYIMMGVAVGTIDWVLGPDRWYPRFRNLSTHALRYEEDTCRYIYQHRGGEEVVIPGDGKWVLLTKSHRGFLDGSIRALGWLYKAKEFNYRDWNRYNEKHGNPIIKVMVPLTGLEKEKREFVRAVKNMGSESVIACPTGIGEGNVSYDISLVEPTSRSYESFRLSLEHYDRKIQIILLGNNLAAETNSVGSNRAAVEVAVESIDTLKASVDSELLAHVLRCQVLRPFIYFNYGPQTPDAFPKWELEPSKEKLDLAQSLKGVGEALNSIKTAGYKLGPKSLIKLQEVFGLELIPLSDAANSGSEDPPISDLLPEGESSEES